MISTKSVLFKIIISFLIIALTTLVTLLLGEAIFPNATNAMGLLLKDGVKFTPQIQQLLLQMKLSQGVQTVGIFLIPAVVVLFVFYRKSGVLLPLTSKVGGYDVLYVFFLIIFSNTFLAVVAQYSQMLPWPKEFISGREQNETLTKLLLMGTGYGDLMLNLFIVAVLPAFCEEFFFRGFLQRVLMKWFKDAHLSILIAAVVFSGFHFDAVNFLPRFLLGAMLGYLFYWTGSLWLPIIAHFLHNAQFVVGMFVINKLKGSSGMGDIDASLSVSSFHLILSVAIIGLLLLSIYRRYMSVKDSSIL